MIENFTIEQYNNIKFRNKLSLLCECCGKEFFKMKKDIWTVYNYETHKNRLKYCSKQCMIESLKKGKVVKCDNPDCNNTFYKGKHKLKISQNNYCSHECALTKTAIRKQKNSDKYGKRSKFEYYLEEQLSELFPNKEIIYNDNKLIGFELDIYLPNDKKAIEINGITHYKPIYGDKKYNRIVEIDNIKKSYCEENKIDLKIIDISKYSKVNIKQKKIFLKEIINFIKEKPL